MTLIILCIDGLSLDLVKRFETNMPYETELEIPGDCYIGDQPFTPDVWPTIFSGRVITHPNKYDRGDQDKNNIFGFLRKLRLKIRYLLIDHGIRWHRNGMKIGRTKLDVIGSVEDHKASYQHFPRCVDKTVLDDYDSFTFNIPGVSDTFFFGGIEADHELHETFKILGLELWRYNFDLAAIYTHLIDLRAHYTRKENPHNLKLLYHEIKEIADYNIKKGLDVLVISDHSCLERHGDKAYFGSNWTPEHKPVSVLDVHRVIKDKMSF